MLRIQQPLSQTECDPGSVPRSLPQILTRSLPQTLKRSLPQIQRRRSPLRSGRTSVRWHNTGIKHDTELTRNLDHPSTNVVSKHRHPPLSERSLPEGKPFELASAARGTKPLIPHLSRGPLTQRPSSLFVASYDLQRLRGRHSHSPPPQGVDTYCATTICEIGHLQHGCAIWNFYFPRNTKALEW